VGARHRVCWTCGGTGQLGTLQLFGAAGPAVIQPAAPAGYDRFVKKML